MSYEAGPYCVIADDAQIGDGTRLGAHVVVHAGTVIGAGCEVQDGAVLGKPPKLARHSTAPRGGGDPLVIEDGAVVCCRRDRVRGRADRPGAIVGDQAFVRERARVGAGSVIGRGSAVDNDVVIGERVRVQTDVYLTALLGGRGRRVRRSGRASRRTTPRCRATTARTSCAGPPAARVPDRRRRGAHAGRRGRRGGVRRRGRGRDA